MRNGIRLLTVLLHFAFAAQAQEVLSEVPGYQVMKPVLFFTDSVQSFLQVQNVDSKPFLKSEEEIDAFVKRQLLFPITAKKAFAYGQLKIGIFVSKAGNIQDLKVLQSVHPDLDAEVLRVLNLTDGNWQPALIDNIPADFRFIYTIHFNIDNKKPPHVQGSLFPSDKQIKGVIKFFAPSLKFP